MTAQPDTQSGSAAWSRLWRSGVLHSCATGIEGNYDGAIRAFWEQRFSTLASDARVVDVGTGNGPLLLLAGAVAKQRGVAFELHGVDVAHIDPPRDVADGAARFAGIRFHPGTPAEHLPFEDGSVDLLCSQFGFEYAPREGALREAVRVVGPRGRVALLLHSDDSIVARTSVLQRDAVALLRDECPIVPRAAALLPVLQRAASGAAVTNDATAEAVRHAFNLCAQALMDEIERVPQAELLQRVAQQIHAVLRAAARAPAEASARLVALDATLRDEDSRLAQLQAALLDRASVDALAQHFAAHGFETTVAAIEQRPGVKMGWTLDATRA